MIDSRPPISTLSGGLQGVRGGDTITITIAPPPGTDPAEIARMVRDQIERLKQKRNADLHDRVDY
ncbi:hypothetical protein [Ruegeria sp. 6PALISEP08]|uniref:hypothetical protein n=1 Tax=Ruegeria sp. 6PALISEP08 TaxID=1225660 RepID=UPI00067EA492|nr:hypothetical protein [Ruegeria sp. 6PALISEP08]